MAYNAKKLFQQVVSLPTAPMHEHRVIAFVRAFARHHKLHCRADGFGNLFLTNRGAGRARMIVMAHMDHPAVELVSCRGTKGVAKIRGGLWRPHLGRARFQFFPDAGDVIKARGAGLRDSGHLHMVLERELPRGTFGMLKIRPYRAAKGILQTRVIDNLANVATVLDWLRAHARSKTKIMGVLTRAEEIGFHGAAAIVRAQSLPRTTPIIVLEASNAKAAKVEIGGGPVLRVGDRLTSFDPRVDCWMRVAAEKVVKRTQGFHYQRALMAGGMMEASLFMLDGLMAGSLALPLGNYHNRGPRGVAPEYIAWKDWVNLRHLLDALVKAPSVASTIRRRRDDLMRLMSAA